MKCGIVDIGSNTIQLSVYHYGNGSFDTLFNQWETVGLAGYVKDGVLSPEGIVAACRTLSRFRTLLSKLEIAQMHVFATASLRNIKNSLAAVAAIQENTGLSVQLLSGEEEAEYSFRGALLGGAPSAGLLADVGGGSTELVAYREGAILSDISLPMGVVALFSSFVADLFPTAPELDAMTAHVSALLDTAPLPPCNSFIGVGGTARAIVSLCNALSGASGDHYTVSTCEVNSLFTRLCSGDRSSLLLLLRTVPDRIHTLLPGLVIFREVLARSGAQTLTMSTTGVREGFLNAQVMKE